MKRVVAAALAALLLVPLTSTARAEEGKITIRSSPSSGAKIVAELDADAELEVIRTENIAGEDWFYVTTEDGNFMGWMNEASQFTQGPTEEAKLTIRSSPSTGGSIVAEGVVETDLEILRTENIAGVNWFYVSVADGNIMGWVKEAASSAQGPMAEAKLTIRSAPSTGGRIIAELDVDAELEVIRTENIGNVTWDYVFTEDGQVMGWIEESMLPAQKPAVTQKASTISAVPVRQQPDPEAAEMLWLNLDTEVEVEETELGWARIHAVLYDGTLSVTGWVEMETLNFHAAVQSKEMVLRAEPSAGSEILMEGDSFSGFFLREVKTVAGVNWARILLGSTEGWIEAEKIGINTLPTSQTVRAVAEDVEVRSAPAANSRLVTRVGTDVEITVLKLESVGTGVWAYVSIEKENTIGWVNAADLMLPEGMLVSAAAPGDLDVFTDIAPEGEPTSTQMVLEELELYTAPLLNSPVITRLEKGSTVGVIQWETVGEKEWAYVLTETGESKGWVQTQALVATVGSQRLNIRSGPGTMYSATAFYEPGDTVRILEEDGEWVRTVEGWANRSYLEEVTLNTLVNVEDLRTGVVTNPTLNIRSNPGSDFNFLGMYVQGDTITILEIQDGWGRTDLGWVDLSHVALEDA